LALYPRALSWWEEQLAEQLKERGVDFKSPDEEGYWPIHYAVKNNQTELISFFLNNGVEVSVKNGHGFTVWGKFLIFYK